MKVLGILITFVAITIAEPPAGPIFIARYLAPQRQLPLIPYPVAGLKPQVHVLARQQQTPQTAYTPSQLSTAEIESNSTEESTKETTTEAQSGEFGIKNGKNPKKPQSEKLVEGAETEPTEQGVYYLYHPTGMLQRVAYSTSDDAEKMAYIAQLRYQNVDPIRDPIYTYDPETFVLQQVQL